MRLPLVKQSWQVVYPWAFSWALQGRDSGKVAEVASCLYFQGWHAYTSIILSKRWQVYPWVLSWTLQERNISRGPSEVCFFSSSNSEVVSTLNVGKLSYKHNLASHLKCKLFRQLVFIWTISVSIITLGKVILKL